MKKDLSTSAIISWIFGIAVFVIGVLNLMLVHFVPGLVYMLLSFVYFPPGSAFLKKWFPVPIQIGVKIILAIFLTMFTLGVSDLGDMID